MMSGGYNIICLEELERPTVSLGQNCRYSDQVSIGASSGAQGRSVLLIRDMSSFPRAISPVC